MYSFVRLFFRRMSFQCYYNVVKTIIGTLNPCVTKVLQRDYVTVIVETDE